MFNRILLIFLLLMTSATANADYGGYLGDLWDLITQKGGSVLPNPRDYGLIISYREVNYSQKGTSTCSGCPNVSTLSGRHKLAQHASNRIFGRSRIDISDQTIRGQNPYERGVKGLFVRLYTGEIVEVRIDTLSKEQIRDMDGNGAALILKIIKKDGMVLRHEINVKFNRDFPEPVMPAPPAGSGSFSDYHFGTEYPDYRDYPGAGTNGISALGWGWGGGWGSNGGF